MRQDLRLGADVSEEDVSRWVASVASSLRLLVTLEATPRANRGSRHWHLKSLGRRGTVELTYLPAGPCLSVAVRINRSSRETLDLAQQLAARAQAELGAA